MADRKLNLRVISPQTSTDRRPYKLQQDSDLVVLRCTTGDLGILVGRMPCTMVLGSGILRSINDGKEYVMAIIGGVAHVQDDIVTVLTDTALFPNEIDQAELTVKINDLRAKIDETVDLTEKNALKSNLYDLRIKLEVAQRAS